MIILLFIIKKKCAQLFAVLLRVCVVCQTFFVSLYKKSVHLNFYPRYFQSASNFDTTLDAINDAVIRTDRYARVIYCNQACLRLFKRESNQLLNQSFSSFKTELSQDSVSENFDVIFDKIKANITSGQVFKSICQVTVTDKKLHLEQHIKGVFDKNNHFLGLVVTLRDVTHSEKLRERLRYQANYDSVTKLFNRYKFEQRLMDAWHDAQENKEQHALLQLDMDRFKLVNDTAGHAAGDQLLREVGQLLKSVVRKSDVCARIGGDEFSVLLLGVSSDSTVAIVQKLNEGFKALMFSYNGQIFDVGASIGATLINRYSPPLVEVKRQADAACFMAKNRGVNCYQLFDNKDEKTINHQEEPHWASRINDAITHHHFRLFFQPIKPFNEQHQKQHIEILLRLQHENNLLNPQVFLPAVERFRLTDKVDFWVVSQTFEWFEQQPELWSELVLTINLSGSSISNEQLITDIVKCHQKYHFPATAICFEITETAAIANMSIATKMVKKLNSVGFSIALDDFGKGFSTFNYLKYLPAQYIKIDGSYVQNVLTNNCDLAIVRSIHTLAKSLNMLTIAEHVQCINVQRLLAKEGIDFVQGFGIAKPAPLKYFHFEQLKTIPCALLQTA